MAGACHVRREHCAVVHQGPQRHGVVHCRGGIDGGSATGHPAGSVSPLPALRHDRIRLGRQGSRGRTNGWRGAPGAPSTGRRFCELRSATDFSVLVHAKRTQTDLLWRIVIYPAFSEFSAPEKTNKREFRSLSIRANTRPLQGCVSISWSLIAAPQASNAECRMRWFLQALMRDLRQAQCAVVEITKLRPLLPIAHHI